MTKKYATFDSNGFVTGFYDSTINKKIPQAAVLIKKEQYENLVVNQDSKAFVDGEIIDKKKPDNFIFEESLKKIRDKKIYSSVNVQGISISIDEKTEVRVHALRTKAIENSEFTTKFTTIQGRITLNSAQIIAIADLVFKHVQACFDATDGIEKEKINSTEELRDAFEKEYNNILNA